MGYDDPVINHDSTNIFVLKDDCAKISSSFKTFIPLENGARSLPIKPLPALSFQDFKPELSDSSARTFYPAAIMVRFLAAPPPRKNEP